jgi:hypothetical protein
VVKDKVPQKIVFLLSVLCFQRLGSVEIRLLALVLVGITQIQLLVSEITD